jgi:hypothetical protein
MTDVPVPANIPWYQSNILRGLAVTFLAQILARTKFASLFTNDDITGYVNDGFNLISMGAVLYAGYSRTKHPTPTVHLTQAKADTANATATIVKTPIPPGASP